MRAYRISTMATAVATACWVLAGTGLGTEALATVTQVRTPPQGVLLEPLGKAGEAIYPAFEGWGPLKDGSSAFLIGYFNRNKEQSVDVPVGPDNRIEPGGPDYGQPTHFHTGRQYGVFAIPIPKDFGTKKLTWTLTANGHTSTVTFWANPQYWIAFYKNLANGNEPPRIKFSATGTELIGPPRERVVQELTGTVGQPVPLTLWAADQPPTTVFEATPPGGAVTGAPARPPTSDAPQAIIGGRVFSGGLTPPAGGGGAAAAAREARGDIRVVWKKYRGPGDVKIAEETIALTNDKDAKKFVEAATTATFSTPGVYWLRAQINDSSGDGGGGDQCCWTTAHVMVTIK